MNNRLAVTRVLISVVFSLITVVVRAQEGTPPVFEASEEMVLNQTKLYLEALKLNDLNTAYHMETGSLDGTLTPLQFRERAFQGGKALLQYELGPVELEKYHAMVIADIGIAVPPMRKPYPTKMRLKWVMREGKLMRETPPPIDKSQFQSKLGIGK